MNAIKPLKRKQVYLMANGDARAVSKQVSAHAKSVLNHAFLLAAGLIVLAFACAFAYRRLGKG